MFKQNMKKYIDDILDNNLEFNAVYEPPNNIPIMRYLIKRKKLEIIIIGNDATILSCAKWLQSEGLKPILCVSNEYSCSELRIVKEYDLKKMIQGKNVFAIITDTRFSEISRKNNIMKLLNECNIEYYIYPYEYEKMPKHDIKSIKYFSEHRKDIKNIIDMLEDKESIETYCEYIRAYENLDFYRLKQIETEKKYFDHDVFIHRTDECIINCGSSNGDTIFYYLEDENNKFEKIYAIEPDENRMKKFKINKRLLSLEEQEKIEEYCFMLGNRNLQNNLDTLFNDKKITLINMDIEGAELETLKGAKNIIKKQKPVLAISAYHMASDLVDIPKYIKGLSGDYQIFFRKYASTFRNKFRTAELVLYAVPKDRLLKMND